MTNYSFLLYNRQNTTSKGMFIPSSATVSDEINGIRHLQMIVPLDTADNKSITSLVKKFDVVRLIDTNSGDYRCFRIYYYSTDKDPSTMTIEADDLLLDLGRIQFTIDGRADIDYTATGTGKYIASNATVTTILTSALSRSDFTVGTVSSELDASPQEYQINNDTALSVLQKIVEKYKDDYPNCGYRRNEDGTIDFVSDLSQTTSAFIINRKNLSALSKEVDVRKYANRLWAWGARSNWQNVHSGIESNITSTSLPTDTKDPQIYVDKEWQWHYGDTADLLYNTTVTSISSGSSAQTITVATSMYANEYRGGIIEITSGDLQGVFRSIDANSSHDIALNDKLHFVTDTTDIIGESCRLAKRVRPANILGFQTITSQVESATATMLYDSATSFGTSQEYQNGYLEFLSGNIRGLATRINSNNNNQLFFSAINTPDTGATYRISANTPVNGCLSIDTPETYDPTPEVAVMRVIDFGGGLIIGKHPQFRSNIASATNNLLAVANTDGSKFSTYQVCQVFTSKIMSGLTRSIDVQQIEISSINGDVLYPTSTLAITPSQGDQIEILTLVNSTEITSWGIWEKSYRDEQIADPWTLYLEASKSLSSVAQENVVYVLDCIDLYKTNPARYQFDKFEVGDKISIYDEETGIIAENLRVVQKNWDPLSPWIVKELVLSNTTQNLSRDAVAEQKEIKKSIDAIAIQQKNQMHEVCTHWDETNKQCRRQNPPNTFCGSAQGNRDGKLRSDKSPITAADCSSYRPAQSRYLMPNGTGIGGTVTGVDNDVWDDTHRFAVDVDFKVSADSYADVIGVIDEASPTSAIDVTTASARIQLDADGKVTPYDTEMKTGCYVQVKRASGSSTLKVRALATILGYPI